MTSSRNHSMRPHSADPLDRRLTEDARALCAEVPATLGPRVVEMLRREVRRPVPVELAPPRRRFGPVWGLGLAAAVVLAALVLPRALRSLRPGVSTHFSELPGIEAGAPLVAEALEPLVAEQRLLVDDARRLAEGFVEGLPAPLRLRVSLR